MPAVKQMNNCLELVQKRIEQLEDRKNLCREKMDVATANKNAVKTAKLLNGDYETEAWRIHLESEISGYEKEYRRWNIEMLSIDIKLKVLKDIESSTRTWGVQCC